METDYLWIFLNSSLLNKDPTAALTLFFLFLARILPIIAQAPFFGSRTLPHPVKVTFAICLFAIFLPQLLNVTTTNLSFDLRSILLMVKELFIGYCIGFLISMPFVIVQNCGIIIDHQRGGAALMVNDPTIQNQSSPFGTLFNMILIYIFIMIDGPFLLIEIIGTSFDVIPPDKLIWSQVFDFNGPFYKLESDLFNRVMVLSIQLATPALLIMLMTDLFLGIANRLAPQVQITFLGMALKSFLGIAIVCLGWFVLIEEFQKQGYTWLNIIKEMLRMFKAA